MTTRKSQKAIVKEGQRRSPRISALEDIRGLHGSGSRCVGDPFVHSETKNGSTCIPKMKRQLDNVQGPAFRTRGRKKIKLRPVEEVTASASASASASLLSPPKLGVKHSDDEDLQKKSDQPSKVPSSTFVLEKRILELVLDTLQRKDTYEIFAEPVDPNEVEDYYTVIEEPMDFGTMRAKLHEGMYKSLEQFEHDVFLIFNNAMHFNSSGTIYFRQARAINELAKKVFDVLKANPENFELEFSETRRKVGRANQGDFRDSTGIKSSAITIGVPSKFVPCSSHGTPNRKSFKPNHGCSDIAKHVDARDLEIPSGASDSRRSFEVDRRSTYRPLSLDEDESIFSTVYGKLKLLEHVNQQDVGYRESLMLFAKDLGPTAQNIVKRKLLGCEIRTASTSAPWRPNTLNTVTSLMSQNPLNRFPGHPNEMRSPGGRVDLEISSGGETAYVNDETDNARVEGTLNADREKACSPLEGNSQGTHRLSFRCDKEYPNQSFCSDLYYSRACAEDLNCSDNGSKETSKKSMMMLLDKSKLVNQEQLSVLENSQTNVLESRLENKCKFQSRPWPIESSDVSRFIQDKSQMQKSSSEHVRGGHENISAVCPTHEISCSSEAMKMLKSDQTVPLASSFIFNLPYLKTRLHQINSSEHCRFSQQDSGGKKRSFSAQVSYQGISACNPPTDLRTTLNSHNQQQRH